MLHGNIVRQGSGKGSGQGDATEMTIQSFSSGVVSF